MIRALMIFLLAALLLSSSFFAAFSSVVFLRKFTFDEDRALDKWGRMILNGKVDYRQMKYGEQGYVEAFSNKACSALYYRIGFKLDDYPFLSWRWKAVRFPDLTNAKTPDERDDFAARVYVIFPFLNFSLSKFIEYVWAEDIPAGTIMTSPRADNIKMIVVKSGKAGAEEWAYETRNVYEDYVKAFGEEPKRSVGAVAIMCDADGTKSCAEASFDDIFIENQSAFDRRTEQK